MKITKSVLSAVLALSILSGAVTSCGESAQDAGVKDPASGAESASGAETSVAGEGEAEEKPEYIPPENGDTLRGGQILGNTFYDPDI